MLFRSPDIGQRAQLLAAEHPIAVLVAGGQHLRSQQCPRAAATATRGGCRGAAPAHTGLFMVGIGGGVNPSQALAGPDKFEQRLFAGIPRGRIVRIVQESTRGVVQK